MNDLPSEESRPAPEELDPAEAPPVGTLVLDGKLRVRSYTPGVTAVHALTPEDVGRPLSQVAHTAVEMPGLPADPLDPGNWRIESEIETEGGRWFLRRIGPQQDAEGRIDGLRVTFHDITGSKRLSMRLRTVRAVSEVLSEADTFEAVVPEMLRAIRETLEAEACLLWVLDGSSKRVRCANASVTNPALEPFVAASHETRFAGGEGLPGLVWLRRKAVWFEDIQGRPGFARAGIAAACGLTSGVATPIIVGKKFHGLIEVFTARQLTREPELIRTLTRVGNEIGQFIRRRELDDKFRDEEARKTAILESALDCIITMDLDGNIVDFNAAAERTFGFGKAEVVGRPLGEVIVPEEFREGHRAGFERFLRTGDSTILGKRIELTAQRAGGETFPVELAINVSYRRDGAPFFTGYLRDITERRQAQSGLEQRAKMSTLHAGLAGTLAGEEPLSRILESCCAHLVDDLGISAARIWIMDDERNALVLRAAAGCGAEAVGPASRVPVGIARIADEGEALLGNGQDDPPDDVWDPAEVPREHLVAVAGYPLRVENRVLGVVALFHCSPIEREAFEQLRPMGGAIAQCVARKISEAKRRENEQRLLENQQELAHVLHESEATKSKLQVLFDQSFYFAAVLDLDGTVRDVNQTALVLCGFERHEVVGLPFWETGWWSGSAESPETIRAAVLHAAGGEIYRSELPYWMKDGSRRMVDLAITPVRNEAGEVTTLLPTGADITERKEAEAQSRRQAEIERFLGKASAMLVSSLDYEDTLARFTQSCVPVLADWAFVDLIEASGRTRRVAVAHANPEDAELARDVSRFPAGKQRLDHPPARGLFGAKGLVIPDFTEEMLVKAAQDAAHEQVIRRVDPRSFVVVPLVARGVTLGALTLMTSHSGRRLGDRDLALAEELAQRAAIAIDNARLYRASLEANTAKSEFLANMSHEIRTPMSSVLGYTDLLTARETDPEKITFLQTIKRNGVFLLDIINDILDLSKIEADKMEVLPERFSLQELIADVRSMMAVRAAEKNLTFEVEYEGPVPEEIQSDPKRLKQILVNLTGNAIKFTEKGQVRLMVRYRPQPEPRIRFEVVDSGIGMTEAQQARLFQPFSQGDASITREFGGTGLGLVISQRLAAMLGGRIDVDSEHGRGSTFNFDLAVGDPTSNRLIQPTQLGDGDAAASVERTTLDCRVLVVDDQVDVRNLAMHLLTQAGATVDFAKDGQQALNLVQRSLKGDYPAPDLILLDMQMPRLDGYETAARLRQMGYREPIIAVTADAMHGDMRRCLENGCDAYLSKPVEARRLLKTVARYAHFGDWRGPRERRPSARADDGPSGARRVLLVDDSVDACTAMKQLLELEGYRVEAAFTGESAIDVAREFLPNVVFLDITLPDMTGHEVLGALRAIPDLKQTRFFALSGHTQPADERRSLEAGFRLHLAKPVDVATLVDLVESGD